jgi:hypothetical protein
MLKLELPFHLAKSADERCLRSGIGERRPRTSEIILAGLSISIETAGKTYEVSANEYSASDSPSFRGTTWPRSLLPLTSGMSVEQQMLLPAGGDAIAMSWRLLGRTLLPARLRVSPIFLAREPISAGGFEIEPETSGGRLAWRPHDDSAKIIADTNGRCAGGATSIGLDLAGSIDSPVQSGVTPATFQFHLGLRPAVLIFSAEPQSQAEADPLIGGFIAQLAQQRTGVTEYDHRRELVAA